MRNFYLQTYRNNRICWKLVYFLRKTQTLRVNNSRILTIKNAKFSGYYFYINLSILTDFQIYISVPLIELEKLHGVKFDITYDNKNACADFIRYISQSLLGINVKSNWRELISLFKAKKKKNVYVSGLVAWWNLFIDNVAGTFLHFISNVKSRSNHV